MKQFLLCIASIIFGFANAQSVLVFDAYTGSNSASPANLVVYNSEVYYTADDPSGTSTGGTDIGRELWKSNGTEAGTMHVADIRPGSAGSSPFNFFVADFGSGETLYFTANDGNQSELYSHDGTTLTQIDAFGTSSTAPLNATAMINGKVYMRGNNGAGDANELLVFNGTSLLAAADSGPVNETIFDMIGYNNQLILYMNTATDDPTIGNELYKYDTTTNTFSLIKDIATGSANSGISNFTVLDGILYFEATGKLWKTDGTEAGTNQISNASAINGTNNYYAWNGELFFEGDDGTGDQLWKYNPTTDTATKLSNIAGANNNHDPSDYVVLDGYLYYAAENEDDTQQHLYRTDGNMVELVDATIDSVDDLVSLNGILYFEANNGTSGRELFSFNPLSLSTSEVSSQASKPTAYPNPSNGTFNIKGISNQAAYKIYNHLGQLMAQGTVTDDGKITTQLKSGIYVLWVNANNQHYQQKLIIK